VPPEAAGIYIGCV